MRKLKLFSRGWVSDASEKGRQNSRPDSLSLVSRQSVLAFLLVLLTTVFGVGNAWALTETFDFSSGTATGSGSSRTISWSGTSCTILQAKGGGSTDVNSSYTGTNLRWYQNHDITFTPKTDITITQIVLVGSGSSYHGQTMKEQTSTSATITTGSSYTTTVAGSWTSSSALKLRMGSQFRLSSVTITYTVASSCEKKVTISKGSPSNGDFTLSKTGAQATCDEAVSVVVTPAPAEHYKTTGVTASNSSNISGPDEDGKYTITYAQNTNAASEINVTFALKDQHTVTWDNNGVTSTSQVYDGEKPVFPTPAPTSCDASSTTFIGWATEAWAGKLESISAKTVYTSADDMPAVTGAVTYYAVFAKVGGEASNLFSWAGGSSADFAAIEGVVLSADGSDYAAANNPYLIKWNGTGKYAIIPVSAQPGKVSIGVKMIGGNSSSKITVQESTSTTGSFTDVEELTISGATNDEVDLETTKSFKATTRAIKLYYTKGSNVGLGPISIEGVAPISDYMTTCAAAGQCAAPTFSVAGGTYNAAQSVELSCETDGATIHYTTSGDAPTSSSATYSSAIAVNENMTIKAIAVKGGSTDSEVAEAVYVLKPTTPEIAGSASFVGATNVTITCETEGVEIRYTTNGDDPTASSTLYSAPFEINASCTVKAIAVKTNWTSSDAASKEFEKIIPYTTIDELLVKAKEVKSTATDVYVTFNNWVVSAVKNSNAYVTDGTKGFIVYASSHGFAVNDKLSGTAACKVQLYKGAVELTNLTATTEGLTVTHDGVITPVEANIADLDTINTGAPIILKNVTFDGTNLVDANSKSIQPFNTLYSDAVSSLDEGKNYNITGIYLQYNATKEVLPRSAEDIEEMKYQLNYILPASGTLSIKQNETLVSSGTKWVEGTKFTLSSTAPSNEYQDGVYTVTDWMEPANDVTADVLSGNTLTMPKYNIELTVAFPEKTAAPISWSNSGEAVNVTLGDTYVLPTLVNSENLEVTCSVTGTEGAATVTDAGVVTILKAGTVTVTATYTATSTGAYKTTAVSYTLTIATPASYSLKNNWNYGEWNWLETTYAGDGKWQLANVVFGGTGVNWRQGDTGDGTWVALADIAGAEIGALDTVTLVLDPSAVTVTATLVGKYVAPDFYITGSAVGGWSTTQQAVKGESYTIKDLAAGSYELKITLDGTWGTAKGFSDLTASEMIAGLSGNNDNNICFTLKTTSDVIVTYTGEVFKLEGNFLLQPVIVKGGWDSWAEHEMTTLSDDKKSVSITMPLAAAENVEFGIDMDGSFRANGYNYHREFTGATGITGNTSNMKLTSDIAGDYTFTWTFGTNALNITFPMVDAGLEWSAAAATAYTVGKTYMLPTLTNEHGLGVTYSSTDGTVATISNEEGHKGEITLVGAGSTVIKATSEATSLYNAGEASYTLTVLAPASVVVTGEAEKDAYEAGETFSFAGLGAKAVYAENDEYEIPANEITWAPAEAPVINANGNVEVKATWQGLTSAVKNIAVAVNTHKVTIAAVENGTLVVKNGGVAIESGAEFAKGTELTVEASANAGYKLTALTAGEENILESKQFTVGTTAVTVAATFTAKAAAGLSWSAATATAYTVGKSYTLPTLSNPNNLENVSYESSVPGVATIAANGEIALVDAGSTVIKATSAETAEYAAGEASYTLTVLAPASVVVTGEAEKDAYEAGETFSFAGLGAKAVYAENDEYAIPANDIVWTNSLTDNKVNAAGDVTVTAEWQSLSGNKVVGVTLLSHELTFNTPTNGTLVVEYNDEAVETGEHFLKGDVLTITATPASIDYKLASLTVNGADFVSGSTYTVGTEDIAIVASFTKKPEPTLSWSINPNNPKNVYLSGRDEDNEFPTAINPQDLPLTYGSLNGSVAEIDAEGNFILHEAGFASMYFNFAGNEAYCSVHREYPLTVYALDRIEIGGEATATEYEAGDAFDRSGLTATAVYKVGDFTENYDVTTKATWNATPATIAANTAKVSVTAAWNSKTSAAEEVAVTVKTHKVIFDANKNHVYLSVWNGETQISSGDEFAKGTVLTVEVELESADYVLATLTANTTDIKATKQFTIGEVDVTIEATSESKPLAPISWSAESASIAMNGDVATLPTLVNELGLGIKYMNNNEEAATIDENTGVITLVGPGEATILAVYVATPESQYRTTLAEYTLTVTAVTYAVTFEAPTNGSLEILNGEDAVASGAEFVAGTELTITATADQGYKLSSLTVNGEDFVSGETYTMGAQAVVVVATFVQDSGTTIDNAEAGEKAQKIMLNNQLFILRGGKMYDAQGKLVK